MLTSLGLPREFIAVLHVKWTANSGRKSHAIGTRRNQLDSWTTVCGYNHFKLTGRHAGERAPRVSPRERPAFALKRLGEVSP